MPSPSEITIIGHGLAGAVLVEVLRERGIRVRMIDRYRAGAASRVAAGIVNPVVLRRIVPSWRAPELLPIAEGFYRELEQRYGVKLWHALPLMKLFSDRRTADEWERKCDDPDLRTFLSRGTPSGFDATPLVAPFGCGTVERCAWLDVPTFLNAQRDRLRDEGALIEEPHEHVRPAVVNPIVHCTGPFSTIPGLVPVKGELLTVRIPGLRLNAMVHRNVFLLPLGEETYRVGSTFVWEDVWSGPSEQARNELLRRLRTMVDMDTELIDHQAGVRPATRDRRPVLGAWAGRPNEFVLNGLGSRGVLLAPWCAMHLADHLLASAALAPEVDAARFGP